MLFKFEDDSDSISFDFGQGLRVYVYRHLAAARNSLLDSIREIYEDVHNSEFIEYISLDSWEGQLLIGAEFEQILQRVFRKLMDGKYSEHYVDNTMPLSGAIKHFEVSIILLHIIDFLIEKNEVTNAWALLTKANYHSATSLQKIHPECEWHKADARSLQAKNAQAKKN